MSVSVCIYLHDGGIGDDEAEGHFLLAFAHFLPSLCFWILIAMVSSSSSLSFTLVFFVKCDEIT